MVEFKKVDSSWIQEAGYDPASRVFGIKTTTGKICYYDGVPPEEYDRFLAAPSKGIFVNRSIKPNYLFRPG